MMPWLMALQAFVTLWLAWCCLRYARSAAADNQKLWSALVLLRKHHSELEGATSAAFGVVDDRFDELDTVVKPARCVSPKGPLGVACELPSGHAGEHRFYQIRWRQ